MAKPRLDELCTAWRVLNVLMRETPKGKQWDTLVDARQMVAMEITAFGERGQRALERLGAA